MGYKISTMYKEQVNDKLFTRIQITEDTPLTIISCLLEGDCTSLSEQELIHLVLEDFYQRTYLNRAENEAITQLNDALDKANTTIKKNDEVNKVTRQALADMSTTVYNNADLIEQLAQHVGFELPNEEGDEEDGTSEQSDSGSEAHNETEGGE